jgi:hypothetical protein
VKFSADPDSADVDANETQLHARGIDPRARIDH